MFQCVKYKDLNKRQKENYNFQKCSAILADYGFYCMWLNDDWQGADFIACHIDGDTFLKVQLKSRLSIEKKYSDKDIYIAFNQKGQWYIYPHDQLRDELLNFGLMRGTRSWEEKGEYTWAEMSKHVIKHMEQYQI